MSLYIKIHEPREARKALLVGKINVLNALKRIERNGKLWDGMSATANELNAELSVIPHEIGKIMAGFPKVELTSLKFDEGRMKCPYCGKFFKSERGLQQHISKQHAIESGKEKKEASEAELDKIEQQIEAIEREITQL